jgi:hypothetical protein
MRVSPRRATVPRLIEQNSRNTLRSPTTSLVGSPAYFLSCGASPIEANWNTRLLRPSWSALHDRVRADPAAGADLTSAPITANGPISTSVAIPRAGSRSRARRSRLDLRRHHHRRRGATSPTTPTVSNFQMPRMRARASP